MSALSVHAPRGAAPPPPIPRFASAGDDADGSVRWLMKRNCSVAPRQLLAFYLSLCLLALAIGAFFWTRGAPFVLPFAGAELLAVGAALLVHARHATDRESLVLRPGRLTVVDLPLPEKWVLPRLRNPGRNHGVQTIAGLRHATSTHVILGVST